MRALLIIFSAYWHDSVSSSCLHTFNGFLYQLKVRKRCHQRIPQEWCRNSHISQTAPITVVGIHPMKLCIRYGYIHSQLFGHREVGRDRRLRADLIISCMNLITQKQYIEFLIVRTWKFDFLAASTIRRAVQSYGYGNTSLALTLPYMKAKCCDNEQSYPNYYDEVEICSESSDAHYKSAIQVRNICMVDCSDLVVCWFSIIAEELIKQICHKEGETYNKSRWRKEPTLIPLESRLVLILCCA